MSFADIAVTYLKNKGYEPFLCQDENEARELIKTLPAKGKWPCLFTPSNTTGEKDFEEFYTGNEDLDMDRFDNLGVIKNEAVFNEDLLDSFEDNIKELKDSLYWTKKDILKLFFKLIPDFKHQETNRYLDSKM